VVIVQSDGFNRSQIQTIVVAVITSNLRLAAAPGNVTLTGRQSGLARDSVINVSQLMTLDQRYLTERVGQVPAQQQAELDQGLRLVLSL
jgi:mRNA interferase MazF